MTRIAERTVLFAEPASSCRPKAAAPLPSWVTEGPVATAGGVHRPEGSWSAAHARFVAPSSGQILLDGVPLADWDLAALRRQFALVSQDVVLFNDTVAANVTPDNLPKYLGGNLVDPDGNERYTTKVRNNIFNLGFPVEGLIVAHF